MLISSLMEADALLRLGSADSSFFKFCFDSDNKFLLLGVFSFELPMMESLYLVLETIFVLRPPLLADLSFLNL